MTYTPDQPQDLPPPDVATTNIRNNFITFANVFDNNHEALNSSNQGKHTNVILQQQLSDPSITGSFDSLFGKSAVAASGTFQQAFVKIPQFLTPDKPNNPMQLTFNVVNIIGPQYQSFLIGGYIIYFGTIPSANTINTQITLVPAPTKIVCVIPNSTKFAAVGINPTKPIEMSVTVNNASQFTINSTFPTGTGDINWVAIAQQ